MAEKNLETPNLYLVSDNPDMLLSEGSYGGGGGYNVDLETKNYVDAKMDAVRAQNDARGSLRFCQSWMP